MAICGALVVRQVKLFMVHAACAGAEVENMGYGAKTTTTLTVRFGKLDIYYPIELREGG